MTQIRFEELVGRTGILCAVEDFKFRIGDLTFEAIEDESDGYRSMLGSLEIVQNIRPQFREEVTISSSDNELFFLTNTSGQVVLTVGTDRADDYYPTFIFNWQPRNLSTFLDIDVLINTVTE